MGLNCTVKIRQKIFLCDQEMKDHFTAGKFFYLEKSRLNWKFMVLHQVLVPRMADFQMDLLPELHPDFLQAIMDTQGPPLALPPEFSPAVALQWDSLLFFYLA